MITAAGSFKLRLLVKRRLAKFDGVACTDIVEHVWSTRACGGRRIVCEYIELLYNSDTVTSRKPG